MSEKTIIGALTVGSRDGSHGCVLETNDAKVGIKYDGVGVNTDVEGAASWKVAWDGEREK